MSRARIENGAEVVFKAKDDPKTAMQGMPATVVEARHSKIGRYWHHLIEFEKGNKMLARTSELKPRRKTRKFATAA